MRKGLSYLAYGVAAGVVLVGASHDALRAAGSSTSDKLALFAEVFNKVRDNYAEKPDDEKMVKSAIDGMLASLDPHSNYFDPKALQDFQSSMKGEEFGGLGLEVMMENGLVKVVSPIDDTPAARAGLMTGDLVTRIDDTAVKGLSLKEAVDKMRGKANTPVKLTVERGSNADLKEFTIVREIIHVQSVRSHLESGDIGYIRITQFNQEAYDGVRKAFDHFRAEPGQANLKGYVLDLRNNPGGLLNQAVEITNAFVDNGDIVSTRGRNSDQGQRYSARSGVNLSQEKPVVVLDQWRFGFGLGDRLRRLAGSQARNADRHADIRQGVGSDHPAARRKWRAQAHHRPLLHAFRPLDPGQGHRSGHQGARKHSRRPEGQSLQHGRSLAVRSFEERR